MVDLGRHNVLGLWIDATDYASSVERIVAAAHQGRPMAVTALAVHGLMTGVLDPRHRYRLTHLDLVVPDGQPVRWALNWLYGLRLADRVYGPTLMLKICRRAAAEGLPVYLYGSTAEVLRALRENLMRQFPSLRVTGTEPSKFRRLTAGERDETVRRIRASGARITFVGLGCPRQEVWAFEFRDALSMPVLAVGAAFAFHAGQLRQAPRALQDRGLEWLFRLSQEPLRLWKRYLLLNPLYLGLLALQRTGLRSFDPSGAPRPTEEMLFG